VRVGIMLDIHDFGLLQINHEKRQIGGKIMEERIYTFYDRYTKVRYENVTKEELETLDKYYNKERYIGHEQYVRNNTCLFSDLATEDTEITDFLTDGVDVAHQIVTEEFFKELFSVLTDRERLVVAGSIVEGRTISEVAEELGISYRQVSRYKANGLEKMLKKLQEEGMENFAEAAAELL
ncbi:MAG: sigma factor-like helix-turn-helix DNA-binding protein, partial [Eubacteriales bacterium]|nr:sigma factor-like helix-turn-helix DNA-binding protein [Eubacteriales bacterium]